MSNARKLGNMTTHGLDGDFNVDPTDNTLVVDSTNNRVGIGSATPTTTLDITGTATATAFAGPLTGNVTGTTSSISNHDTDALSEGSTNLYYTNARADARAQLKIDALVDSAPGTLDTLNELAAALGDDANFSTTVTNSIATKLPLAGGTMTGNLTLGDNVKIEIGSNSGGDLQIYHDGNSKIADVGGGKLELHSDGTGVFIQKGATEYMAKFETDGAVTLYHNNVAKLATTSTGIDVTGNATATKFVQSGTAGSIFYAGEFSRSGAGITTPDVWGTNSTFVIGSSSSTEVIGLSGTTSHFYGNVGIGITPRAKLDIVQTSNRTSKTGTTRGVLHLQDGDTPANNEITAITFESNSNNASAIIGQTLTNSGSELFFGTSNGYVSGVTNTAMIINPSGNVGIGTANPQQLLHVNGGAADTTIQITNSASGSAATDGFSLTVENPSGDVNIRNREATNMRFYTSNDEKMRITSTGEIRVQNQTLVDSVNTNHIMIFPNNKGISIGSAYTYGEFNANNGNVYIRANSYPANTGSESLIYLQTANSTGGQSSDVVVKGGKVGIGTDDPSTNLEISSIYNTALRLSSTRNTNSWIVGDSIGRVEMYSADGTAPTPSVRSSIDAVVENTAGNAVGLAFKTYNNTERMRIDTSGNVGIGITNPQQLLHVQAGSTGNGTIRVGGGAGLEISHNNSANTVQRIDSLYRTTSADAELQLRTGILTAHIGSSTTESMRLDGANGLQIMTDSSNGTSADNVSIRYNGTAGGHMSGYLFRDKRNSVNAAIKNDLQDDSTTNYAAHLCFQTTHAGTLTTQMTIDRYGQVMMPNQPSFRAYTTTDYTANGTFEGSPGVWAEQHDNNSDFSNGRFTAPVDGVYLFEVMWDSNASQGGINLLVNTGSYYVKWEPTGRSDNSWESRHYSTTVKLSSGDYVRLVGVHASGSTPFHMGGGHWGFFSGHLLG